VLLLHWSLANYVAAAAALGSSESSACAASQLGTARRAAALSLLLRQACAQHQSSSLVCHTLMTFEDADTSCPALLYTQPFCSTGVLTTLLQHIEALLQGCRGDTPEVGSPGHICRRGAAQHRIHTLCTNVLGACIACQLAAMALRTHAKLVCHEGPPLRPRASGGAWLTAATPP
jgi:hypothetical protein